MDYLIIALKSIAVYAFIVAAIRLFGKKELAQLSVIDLAFILLISNAVAADPPSTASADRLLSDVKAAAEAARKDELLSMLTFPPRAALTMGDREGA